jgi:hypothetical protein
MPYPKMMLVKPLSVTSVITLKGDNRRVSFRLLEKDRGQLSLWFLLGVFCPPVVIAALIIAAVVIVAAYRWW